MNGLDEPFFIGASDQAQTPSPSIFQRWQKWLLDNVPIPGAPGVRLGPVLRGTENTRQKIGEAVSRGTENARSVVSRGTDILGQQAERVAWGLVALLLLAFGLYALARKA